MKIHISLSYNKPLLDLVLKQTDSLFNGLHFILYFYTDFHSERKDQQNSSKLQSLIKDFVINCERNELQKSMLMEISPKPDGIEAEKIFRWIGNAIGERADAKDLADFVLLRLSEKYNSKYGDPKIKYPEGLLLGIAEKMKNNEAINYLKFVIENSWSAASDAALVIASYPNQEDYLWQRIIDPKSNYYLIREGVVPSLASKKFSMTVDKYEEFFGQLRNYEAEILAGLLKMQNSREAFIGLMNKPNISDDIKVRALKALMKRTGPTAADYTGTIKEILSKVVNFDNLVKNLGNELSNSIDDLIIKVEMRKIIEWATTADNETLRKNASYILTNAKEGLVEMIKHRDKPAYSESVRLIEAALAA